MEALVGSLVTAKTLEVEGRFVPTKGPAPSAMGLRGESGSVPGSMAS